MLPTGSLRQAAIAIAIIDSILIVLFVPVAMFVHWATPILVAMVVINVIAVAYVVWVGKPQS